MARSFVKRARAGRGPATARHSVRRAALRLGGVGVLYASVSAVLAIAGAVPSAPVFFGMDVDNYYFWQMIFVLLWTAAVWLLTSGILLAFRKKGAGGPAIVSAAGRALAGPLLVTWVPLSAQALLMALGMSQAEWVEIWSPAGFWQTLYIGFYAVAAGLACGKLVLAARRGGQASWLRAVLSGTLATAVAFGAYILFIR